MMNAEARRLGLTTRTTRRRSGSTRRQPLQRLDLVRLARLRPWALGLPRADRRDAERRTTLRQPRSLCRQPQRPGRASTVDQRGKTGHTADAGYVLVSSGHRGWDELIGAVLGTSSERERDIEHDGPARLRVCHVPPADAGARRPASWPGSGRATGVASTSRSSRRATFTRVLPIGATRPSGSSGPQADRAAPRVGRSSGPPRSRRTRVWPRIPWRSQTRWRRRA